MFRQSLKYRKQSRVDILMFNVYIALSLVLLLPWEAQANQAYPGGQGSVDSKPFASFMLPMTTLNEKATTDFHAGKALAHQPWVKAPSSTTARDGLGPLYNARTCLACHINGGRGLLPNDGKTRLNQGIVRLSIPGVDHKHGVVAEPNYGDQLQSQSTAIAHQLGLSEYGKNEVRPEANVYIDWIEQVFRYPDGESLLLRKPQLRFENLGYGEFHPDTLMSLRNAPALHGVGLLEQIPQAELLANIEKQQQSAHVSGRMNRVWNPEFRQMQAGRLGWKANKPTIKVQTAAAFQGDVGISSELFPNQPCESKQHNCAEQKHGNDATGVEINNKLLDLVVHFTQNIGVPKARNMSKPAVMAGKSLFAEVGCVECHRPSYTTQKNVRFPALSEQQIWPYTDLLLHDMGEGLADNRPDFLASGREWKTPPLWGIGLSNKVNGSGQLLHDGRARNVEEAILWHGGEAEFSRQQYINLQRQQRLNLIKFVESI